MKKLNNPSQIKASSALGKNEQSLISPALTKLRKEIDLLDRNIWSLLGKRFALTKKVAKIKQKLHISVYDAEREKAVLEQIDARTADPEVAAGIRELYKSLFGISKHYQQPYTEGSNAKIRKYSKRKVASTKSFKS
jgi:chorismate mutase